MGWSTARLMLVGEGVCIKQVPDHALILGMMLLGFLLDELHARPAQGHGHFYRLVVESKIFWRSKKPGTISTGPMGSSLYLIFFFINTFTFTPGAQSKMN